MQNITGNGSYILEYGENIIPIIVTSENGSINTYQVTINREFDFELLDFKEAWALLRKVPYGETVSYGGLARRLELKRADGRRVSARAIGGAVHRNPIALIVPCHRVVGADGSLTGYAGGIETKIRLLQLEGVLKQTERTDVDCESIDRIWRSTR